MRDWSRSGSDARWGGASTMTTRKEGLTRRHYLAATGAILTAGIGGMRIADALRRRLRGHVRHRTNARHERHSHERGVGRLEPIECRSHQHQHEAHRNAPLPLAKWVEDNGLRGLQCPRCGIAEPVSRIYRPNSFS